jgi:hypothetical protein
MLLLKAGELRGLWTRSGSGKAARWKSPMR